MGGLWVLNMLWAYTRTCPAVVSVTDCYDHTGFVRFNCIWKLQMNRRQFLSLCGLATIAPCVPGETMAPLPGGIVPNWISPSAAFAKAEAAITGLPTMTELLWRDMLLYGRMCISTQINPKAGEVNIVRHDPTHSETVIT